MSIHVEWAHANGVTLSLVGKGAIMPDGQLVDHGDLALVIEYDGDRMLVVEGTAQQLRERVYEGLSLPIPAGAPIVDVPDTIEGVEA